MRHLLTVLRESAVFAQMRPQPKPAIINESATTRNDMRRAVNVRRGVDRRFGCFFDNVSGVLSPQLRYIAEFRTGIRSLCPALSGGWLSAIEYGACTRQLAVANQYLIRTPRGCAARVLRVSFTSCIPCTEPCSIQLLRTVYIAVSFQDNNYRLEPCLERKREKLDYPRTKRKDESCMLLE